MSDHDPAKRPTSPAAASAADDDSFPNPGAFGHGGPPSIISSRMTDIGTEDGGDGTDGGQNSSSTNPRRSGIPSEAARTASPGAGAARLAWPQSQPLRRNYLSGLAAKRASVGAGSVGGTAGSTRPPSSTGRSHVPSLTSHAFFHPMSSQKLQAQRGGSRPPTMNQQYGGPGGSGEDDASAIGADDASNAGARQSVASNPTLSRLARHLAEDGGNAGAPRAPGSRGSEMTEQETLDRITANTSPTQGHHPTGSLSESVRPLHRGKPGDGSGGAGRNLRLNVDKSYKELGSLPSPIKSPRSFRSGFLLPGKSGSGGGGGGDQGQNGSNRNLEGAEKLSSTASSPRLPAADHAKAAARQAKRARREPKTRLGRVHQYFEGNMIFCFGGRWQNAKQRPVNIATGLLLVVPCTLFFVFSAPWLWYNISPAIPITMGYLFYICLSSFVHASVSDPGVSLYFHDGCFRENAALTAGS